MDQYLLFALIGLGFGVVYAAIGMGVVITYRGTGIINFATGAMAMWGAYVYDELDKAGDLIIPVFGIPHRIGLAEAKVEAGRQVGDSVPLIVSFGLAIVSCAAIGLLVHFLVFRPLRRAPILAKVVASIGVLIFIQALTALQFGSEARKVNAIVPTDTVTIAGSSFSQDRLWVGGFVVVVAVLLWAYFKYTRIGLATSAAAENERSVSLARYSPQVLAGATWILSSVVVGTIGILAASINVLNPTTYALAIVPALAAALVGRLQSIAVTVASALALGSFQSIIVFQTTKDWWPDWAVIGVSDAVPFVVIIIALFVVGDSLPSRGAVEADPLPEVIRPHNRPHVIFALVAVGAAAIVLTDGSYRFGIITSMIVAIIMLSLVVLTGLVGQISLAQAAFAGVAGLTLSKLAEDVGIPFPFSLLLAALVAMVFGVLVGIPALRIRGAQLAVVTLAGAVALERFVFRNNALTSSANTIPEPKIFGLDLGVREGRVIARWQFGLLVLFFLTVAAVLVANLARSATGRRFLSVRSNERAAASVGINVSTNKLLAFAISSFLAGIGGGLIGYSRGQLSADSFATLVGLSFLAFAYLGGITSVSGALVAGIFAPLGIGFVVGDRLIDLGNSYSLMAGIGLILTAIFNPQGIAGATRENLAKMREKLRPPPVTEQDVGLPAGLDTPGSTEPPAATRRPPRPDFAERPIVLDATEISVRFGGLRANDNVSLQVKEGQIVGLIGPNGAGKTTFIDAITGFVPSTGTIVFDGVRLDELKPHQRARRGLARTWQSLELFTDLSVEENVRVANETASIKSVLLDFIAPTREIDLEHAGWAVELMGLTERADSRPTDLPLGQQKLVGVARALASRPRVVMLDEPAAGLDTHESRSLGERLFDIVDHDIAVFLIDHDMGLVLDVCDYIYVLDFGEIIAEGTPAEIRTNQSVITAYLGQEASV